MRQTPFGEKWLVKVESHQLEVLPTGEAAAHRAQRKAAEKAVEASEAEAMQQEPLSLWLRDACRDDNHVATYAGERLLTATPG